MKIWQMEYYCGYPNIRVRFDVSAESFEEAVNKGDDAISSLRRTATYQIREIISAAPSPEVAR